MMLLRTKGQYQSNRKRKQTHTISILDVIIADRSSFLLDHILKVIKNAQLPLEQ